MFVQGPHPIPAGFNFLPIKVGGGGLVVGLQVAADGAQVCRVDIYGAYYRAAGATTWTPVITTNSLPNNPIDQNVDLTSSSSTGPYGIAIAPSSSNILYMSYNGYMYKSSNGGNSWTRLTGFTQIANLAGNFTTNSDSRIFDDVISVDPVNPNIVVAGSQIDGVFYTLDGGTTWSTISGITTASAACAGLTTMSVGGGYLITFDPTSVVGGVTKTVYISSYGTGVYKSTTGVNGTFTIQNSTGMPTSHVHMKCDKFGVLWVVDNTGGGTPGRNACGSVKRYLSSTWTTPLASGGPSFNVNIVDVAIDPGSNTQVTSTVLAHQVFGGDILASTDGGTTFAAATSPTYTSPVFTSSGEVGWAGPFQSVFPLSAVSLRYDPSGTKKLILAGGVGIWTTSVPAGSTITWISETAGTESLTSNGIISPPTVSNLTTWSFDVALFNILNPTIYPSNYSLANPSAIVGGWDVDYASNTPSTMFALVNGETQNDSTSISTDGGSTWTAFASKPTGLVSNFQFGGNICGATPSNILWVAGQSNGQAAPAAPFFTTNGGSSWSSSTFAGFVNPGVVGQIHRKVACVDRDPTSIVSGNGTYYVYVTGGSAGVYKSTNGGSSFSSVFSGAPTGGTGSNDILQSTPSLPGGSSVLGHLWMSSGGPQSGTHPVTTCPFVRSTDGGVTWNNVAPSGHTLYEAYAYGFGAIFPGKSYPSLCVVGWYDGVFGCWQSIDNCISFQNIGDGYPAGILNAIRWIDGNKSLPEKWYFSGGSGWFYRTVK